MHPMSIVQIHYFKKGFYKSDFQANDFHEITVPSCWAILGYEEPVYRTWKDEPQSEGFLY